MLLTALTFIAILSILVFIHEFGHYIVARLIGVTVEEFGFGLPPRLFGKKIRGTLYSINALPIGGFVKLAGEDAEDISQERTKFKHKKDRMHFFWARSKKERACILLAGVTMNFLLAWGITILLLTQGVIEPVKYVFVETVAIGSPAQTAGIQVKDRIDAVSWWENGTEQTKKIIVPMDLISLTKEKVGLSLSLSIIRNGEMMKTVLSPRVNPPAGEGPIGVSISSLERHKYPLVEAPGRGLVLTFERAWQMLSSLGNLLYRLATGIPVAREEVAGPVGIAAITGEAVKYGWEAVLEFMSILSLNLALINVLPLPALDGGRLAFVVLEKLGKKARPDIERTIHQIGMIFLLALVALITLNDILRLVK